MQGTDKQGMVWHCFSLDSHASFLSIVTRTSLLNRNKYVNNVSFLLAEPFILTYRDFQADIKQLRFLLVMTSI